MNTQSNEVVLDVNGLQKSFGGKAVLNGLTLQLHKGENLVVLGKSGTGKSVLIKCCVGLIKPDGGELRVFNEDITKINAKKLNDVRKRMGFLFQGAALYDSMPVRENLFFPLERMDRKIKRDELEGKAMKVLEEVGLADAIDKMPSELSGGMRKRIGLARTIITSPEIMMYDEPTTGLDPVTSAEISDLINKVREDYQTSSIIITHDMPCAKTTADRIMMIRDGVIYAEGSYESLEKSDDEWIRSFFNH